MEHTPADQSEEASWKARLNRLNHDLAKSEFAKTLNVNDFKTFDAALRNLFVAYSKSPLQRLATSLEPHFDHVRSFHVALSATIQQSAVASSIWSASLAVIECTCRHVSYMEETFESLARFYQTFPMFTRYINLFSSSPSLRLCMQDLYSTYSDFCLRTIKYMRKGPIGHVVQNLFSSASRRSLKSILKRWDDQTAAFEEHAKLAFRERVLAQQPQQALHSGNIHIHHTTNMPRLQTYFTGRALFLSELHETLSRNAFGNPAEPRSCLIHAMGGMGKTQSALAYGFQFERYYDYRFWIRSETPDLLTDSFASVATILGINTTAPSCFNFVKEWMENTDSSWLVIFDNVEKETISAVESLLPSHVSSSRPSAIILTSQFEQHKHIVRHSIALKSLSTEESVQLLLKCLRHDPQEVSNDDQRLLEEVSELLGGFPMGVAHVGGYISESKHSLRSFRDFFRTRWQERVWEEDSVISQHDKRLGIIWDLALDELPPKARKLIHIMAYLNPDVIPEDWIENDIAKNPDWGEDENLKVLWDMPRSLCKRCLVDVVHENDTDRTIFSIHRSLQMALRLKLDRDPNSRSIAFNHALSIVSRAAPRPSALQTPNPQQWPAFQQSNPHALVLCNAFRESQKTNTPLAPSLELAEVLYSVGFHVWATQNPITQDGILLLETAEDVLDLLGRHRNDRLRADILCMKSGLLELVGLETRAASLKGRQDVCRIRESILRAPAAILDASMHLENEHLLFNALNDLALGYLQSDQFLRAEKIFDQCFAKYQEWGTIDTIPFEYGKYYHNIALVRMYQGRYDEAITLLNQGVSIKDKTDGQDSPRYWWYQYDVANIMVQSGQLRPALAKHLQILENRLRVCGALQEVTLQSFYTVGAILCHLKNFPEAEKNLRECIKRSKKARWHAGALGRAKWHLAEVLDVQKKENEYAQTLRNEARNALDHMYNRYGEKPKYLENANIMALFDWTQPSFDGRWTGIDLLPLIQKYYGVIPSKD